MSAEFRVCLLLKLGLLASLLLGACSIPETQQLTLNELRSRYDLEICAGSKALPKHEPWFARLSGRAVVFDAPSDECKVSFFKSVERAAKEWEHPFNDPNRMLGTLSAGPVFMAQVQDRRIFVMISYR